MPAQGFIMQDFAAGANAITSTRSAAVDLQTKIATQADVVQESHNKASESALKLQTLAMDTNADAAERKAAAALFSDPDTAKLSSDEVAAKLQNIAMQSGGSISHIQALGKTGAELTKYKDDHAKAEHEQFQNLMDQTRGLVQSMPAEQVKPYLDHLLQESKKGGQEYEMLTQAEQDLARMGPEEFKKKWGGEQSPLLSAKERDEMVFKRQAAAIQAAHDASRERIQDAKDASTDKRTAAYMQASLNLMARAGATREEKEAAAVESSVDKSTIRMQSILRQREGDAIKEHADENLTKARERASHNWFGTVDEDKDVIAAQKKVDDYKTETDKRLKAEILSQKGEAKQRLMDAHPELFPPKAAEKPAAKPAENDIKAQVEATGVPYEPDKYEYGINPNTGKLGRQSKGGSSGGGGESASKTETNSRNEKLPDSVLAKMKRMEEEDMGTGSRIRYSPEVKEYVDRLKKEKHDEEMARERRLAGLK